MEATEFALTYDYRCPFARNAHDHVVTALRADAPFNVHFSPFVLGSAFSAQGEPSVWDDPSERPVLVALAASVVVRDRFPDQFLDAHVALFNLRHDLAGDLRDDATVRRTLDQAGIDGAAVYDELADGWPFETVRHEHERAIAEHDVFGVPTFIANDRAAFVRVMTRPAGDAKVAATTVETVLSLLYGHPEINEFKHTSIPQ